MDTNSQQDLSSVTGSGCYADSERLRHHFNVRMVREVELAQGVGVEYSCAVRFRRARRMRDFRMSRCTGQQGSGFKFEDVWSSWRADIGSRCWMVVWVNDVDSLYECCLREQLDVTFPPAEMLWNAREMHLHHPDGHVFRIAQRL